MRVRLEHLNSVVILMNEHEGNKIISGLSSLLHMSYVKVQMGQNVIHYAMFLGGILTADGTNGACLLPVSKCPMYSIQRAQYLLSYVDDFY